MGRIRVFAGPNGSGKSTLFKTIQHKFNTGVFVNADLLEQDIVRSGLIDLNQYGIKATEEEFLAFKNSATAKSMIRKAASEKLTIDLQLRENFLVDKEKESHSYESALAALFIRNQLMGRNKTFSYETVMSHPSKVSEITDFTSLGYRAYLYYVCTDDPLVNIDRVENRVEKGGHPVSEDRIKSRYTKSLENLLPAINTSYRSYLFDNSGKDMKLIAEVHDGNLKIVADSIPNWVHRYVFSAVEQTP